MNYYIGIDLGGTNMVVGLVDENYKLLRKLSRKTNAPRSIEDMSADLVSMVKKVVDESGVPMEKIVSVGVGVPGTANIETGRIEYANNLGFEDTPFVKFLEEGLGKKVYFDNDANAAAWGEFLAGVGKGSNSLVAVTLGTGIGGGIILDHKIYRGYNYASGEIGHTVIKFDGIECNCGRRGCFEVYASATALILQTKEAMENNMQSMLWKLCNDNIELIEGKTVFQGVAQGDATAIKVLEQYIFYLSIGIIDIINTFQPEILCIGGGISKAGNELLGPLREKVDSLIYTRNSKKQTKIVMAQLDNDAGIIGAALLGI